MSRKPSALQTWEQASTEVRIYPVELGYRIEISDLEAQLYWHPGIFPELEELWRWLTPQLEALVEEGITPKGEWLLLEEDFENNFLYQDWFVCKTISAWQGYDPLTNRCYSATSLPSLEEKIDRIEDQRMVAAN